LSFLVCFAAGALALVADVKVVRSACRINTTMHQPHATLHEVNIFVY
jgi:hypothetical protein